MHVHAMKLQAAHIKSGPDDTFHISHFFLPEEDIEQHGKRCSRSAHLGWHARLWWLRAFAHAEHVLCCFAHVDDLQLNLSCISKSAGAGPDGHINAGTSCCLADILAMGRLTMAQSFYLYTSCVPRYVYLQNDELHRACLYSFLPGICYAGCSKTMHLVGKLRL